MARIQDPPEQIRFLIEKAWPTRFSTTIVAGKITLTAAAAPTHRHYVVGFACLSDDANGTVTIYDGITAISPAFEVGNTAQFVNLSTYMPFAATLGATMSVVLVTAAAGYLAVGGYTDDK